MIDHVCGSLDHTASSTGWANVSSLARKGDHEIVAAAGTVHTGEPVGQDAALQVLLKSVLDVKGNVRGEIVALPGIGQVGLQMLTDDLMQKGCSGTARTINVRAGNLRIGLGSDIRHEYVTNKVFESVSSCSCSS